MVDNAAKLAKKAWDAARALYNRVKDIAMKGVRWVENQIKKMKNVTGKMSAAGPPRVTLHWLKLSTPSTDWHPSASFNEDRK